MKVVIVNDSDCGGGAAIATYRNFMAIKYVGVDAKLFVQNKIGNDVDVIGPVGWFEKIVSKYICYVEYFKRFIFKPTNSSLHSIVPISSINIKKLNILNPDIVNLNWICNGFVKPEDLKKINCPIVWTLHDTWAFCGAEHYPGKSKRYIDGYVKSNRCKKDKGLDLDRWVWNRKIKSWKNINFTIVSPSNWLADCARKSFMFRGSRVEVIPNCVDIDILKPIEKRKAKKILNLDVDKKYILFGAINAISDSRKGANYLIEALKLIDNNSNELELIIFGQSKPKNEINFGIKANYLGRIFGEDKLRIIYSAAEVFIAPSVEDNLPNTIMEAMACGTPCVSFNIGGIPDMIDHKKNGYLAEPFNCVDLKNGIDWVLKNGLEELSEKSRKKVVDNFSFKIVGEKYKKLYESVLSRYENRISVIVATYNCRGEIEKTIKSFNKQTYKDKELIIIDGGSTDGTVEIIKKYKKDITYWVSEPDKGISDAFNKGVKVAKGDYLYFMGAGDYFWSNDSIEKIMENIDSEKDMLICGKINRVTEDGKKVLYTSSIDFKKWKLLYKMGLPHQALFTNKKYFEKYGLFDLNCKYAMDYELLLRAYKEFPEVVIKDIVVAAWREGGIGTNKIDKILSEYHEIRLKNRITPVFVLNLIYFISKLRYKIWHE